MLYKPKFLSPSATGDTKFLEKIETNLLGNWDASVSSSNCNFHPNENYNYKTGDYVIVTTVPSVESNKYKPNGSSTSSSGDPVVYYIANTTTSDTIAEGDIYYYNNGWQYISQDNLPAYEFSCICDGNTKVTGGDIFITEQGSVHSIEGYVGYYTIETTSTNYFRSTLCTPAGKIQLINYPNSSSPVPVTIELKQATTLLPDPNYKIYFPGYNSAITYEQMEFNFIAATDATGVSVLGTDGRWSDIKNGTAIPMIANVSFLFALDDDDEQVPKRYYLSEITLNSAKSKQQYYGTFLNSQPRYLYIQGFQMNLVDNIIKQTIAPNKYPVDSEGNYTKFIWSINAINYNSAFADDATPQWYVTLTDGTTTVQSGTEAARVIQHPELVIQKEAE